MGPSSSLHASWDDLEAVPPHLRVRILGLSTSSWGRGLFSAWSASHIVIGRFLRLLGREGKTS